MGFCEETQCEYRQMCVIDDTDGSGWVDDYLTVSELKQLNASQINLCCNINVLHIWCQEDGEEDELEFMKVYHSNSKIQQKTKYEWNLNHIVPSCVFKESTICYSPRFDVNNWTLIFADGEDKFLCGLKLLSIPFGIGMLVVQCQFIVRRNDTREKYVRDRIIESYKYGEEDDEELGHSKEWKKSELFGSNWETDFCLSQISVEIELEIIHIEGINDEQIFRINWPLYGIECDNESGNDAKHCSFRITKDQFDAESFGFNYMIGRLQNELYALKNEISELKKDKMVRMKGKRKDIEMEYIVNDEDEMNAMKEWLIEIGMENYFELFMKNGFNSLEMIKEINDKNDLQFIGIEVKAHQIKLINKINVLKQ